MSDMMLREQNSARYVVLTNSGISEVSQGIPLEARYGGMALGVTASGWTGALIFEVLLDTTANVWQPASGINIETGASELSTSTTGIWKFDITGIHSFRVRHVGWAAGTVTAVAIATPFPPGSMAFDVQVAVGDVNVTVGSVSVQNPVTFDKLEITPDGRAQTNAHLQVNGNAVSVGNPVPVSIPTPVPVTGSVLVQGTLNEGAAATANPVAMGGRAANTAPAPIAAGTVVNLLLDTSGRLAITAMGNTIPVTGTVAVSSQGANDGISPVNVIQVGGSTVGAVLKKFLVETDGRLIISDGGTPLTVDGVVTSSSVTEGTDGTAVPAKSVQIAGATSGNILQTIRTDTDGSVQVISGATPVNVTITGTPTIQGTVTADSPKTGTATSAYVATDGAGVTILSANGARRMFKIQNQSTVPVAIKYGNGINVSVNNYSVVLQAGVTTSDGKGGYVENTVYTGVITAQTVSGAGGAVMVTEL